MSEHLQHIQSLLPDYERDLAAVGTNRIVDKDLVDDRPWHEVHGLTAEQAAKVVAEHRK